MRLQYLDGSMVEYHLPFPFQEAETEAARSIVLTGTARLKLEGHDVVMHPVVGGVFPPFVIPRWGLVRLRKLPAMGQSGRVFLLYLEERYHGEILQSGDLPMLKETSVTNHHSLPEDVGAQLEPVYPDRFENHERRLVWLSWVLQTYWLTEEPNKVRIQSGAGAVLEEGRHHR